MWWDIGKNVGYVLLALGLLFVLLRAVKTTPAGTDRHHHRARSLVSARQRQWS